VLFFFARVISKLYSALFEDLRAFENQQQKIHSIKFILIKETSPFKVICSRQRMKRRFRIDFVLNSQNYQSGFLCFATRKNIPAGVFEKR
jgi:hypothetical protein